MKQHLDCQGLAIDGLLTAINSAHLQQGFECLCDTVKRAECLGNWVMGPHIQAAAQELVHGTLCLIGDEAQ